MSFHEPRQALYGAMSKHVDLGASAEDDSCFPRFSLVGDDSAELNVHNWLLTCSSAKN